MSPMVNTFMPVPAGFPRVSGDEPRLGVARFIAAQVFPA